VTPGAAGFVVGDAQMKPCGGVLGFGHSPLRPGPFHIVAFMAGLASLRPSRAVRILMTVQALLPMSFPEGILRHPMLRRVALVAFQGRVCASEREKFVVVE
jgi:hypothetical protein